MIASTNNSGISKQPTADSQAHWRRQVLQDEIAVPSTMMQALDCDDPAQSLRILAEFSKKEAIEKTQELNRSLQNFEVPIPDILLSACRHPNEQHPLDAAIACADSIRQALSKIASGGSQASQEIRQLEGEKRDLEEQAEAVEMALMFRRNADVALQALQTEQWHVAAQAIRPWLDWQDDVQKQQSGVAKQCRAYAGEYYLKQLATAHERLKESLLEKYEEAVRGGDLKQLGDLTPTLGLVQLESSAVRLYVRFLKGMLQNDIRKQLSQKKAQQTESPFVNMGIVYNTAVSCLRHHLPMVSHCLWRAEGDAAVVQLVHVQVEEAILPLIEQYQAERQLISVSKKANHIYAALEERYTGRQSSNDDNDAMEEAEDCGFSIAIGSLSDADSTMQDVALCIQHSESYLRFVEHTCSEINKARQIRWEQEQAQRRLERQRQEWNGGKVYDHDDDDEKGDGHFRPLSILPSSTPLHLAITELGGQYASIERCLLLASMQRAFILSPESDPRYYRAVATSSNFPGNKALQTSLVESCMFAARHGTQRAFATGHTATASAMVNFCSDCITGVLLEVLSQRAEESGVALLKPGEGLLVGSGGLFNNASNLIRHGAHSSVVGIRYPKDELLRKQQTERDIASACATINDLEIVSQHVEHLEAVLDDSINKGFAPDRHETEQLRMCVKSLSSVKDNFRGAANSSIEALESVLKSRLRLIVGEAIGSDNSSSATFMASSVMGGAKAGDKSMLRMVYDLDEDGYNLMQLSESYVARLCTLLDELLESLRVHLLPRLSDTLLLSVLGTVCKRLEASLRKCQFTALGALALDSDVRDFLAYAKERLYSPELRSNTLALTKACPSLARLVQIAKLLTVDDLEDVVDLIGNSKRKGNWDLKLEEAKALLCSRVEFESSRVHELLRLPDDD